MVYMDEWDYGQHALKENGAQIQLVGHSRHFEEVRHATLFTRRFNNYFADGVLSGNRHSLPLCSRGGWQ